MRRRTAAFPPFGAAKDFSETQSIRPYVPGDPVRQIHWKLSAKTGQTLLREIGLPQTGGILLALAVDGAATPDAAGSVVLRSAPPLPGALLERALRTAFPLPAAVAARLIR